MLHWFHATRRKVVTEYLDLLERGCVPAPFETETKQLELSLEIHNPRVYCYLGRTREQFGEFAVALRAETLPIGEMCPFDSGGLVRKIKPISEWTGADRNAYLGAYSFTTQTINDNLSTYPALKVSQYLDAIRPTNSGPHELWPQRPTAEIWLQNEDWRAWTWEGRWTELPVQDHLFAWSCTPALFQAICEQMAARNDLNIEHFVSRYRDGGVGALIAQLKTEQSSV